MTTKKIRLALGAILIMLPLALAACGTPKAPVTPPANDGQPLDQTSGQSGLTPADNAGEVTDQNFQNAAQPVEIKSDADIENILNNAEKDSTKQLKDVDDADLTNF